MAFPLAIPLITAGAGLAGQLMSRWRTPSERAAQSRYEDIYGQLAPQPWETPGYIGEWGQAATAQAQKAYQDALGQTLQRVAPGIAGRGMWGSPGVRGALQLQAAQPLQQNLAQQLMGIQAQQAQMTGQAHQNWMNDYYRRLMGRAGIAGDIAGLGLGTSDIWSGMGALGSAGLQAWGASQGGK